MAKKRSGSNRGDTSHNDDSAALGSEGQSDAPIEIFAENLTADELRELAAFDGGAEPEDDEPGGFDTGTRQRGAEIPSSDPATGGGRAARPRDRQDAAREHSASAAPAASSGRLTSLRVPPDRGPLREAEASQPEGAAATTAELDPISADSPRYGTDPGGRPPQSVSPAPHHHPAGADGSAAFAPERPARQDARGFQSAGDQHPDLARRKRSGNETFARKPALKGAVKPVVKGLRFAAILLLAAGFGAAGYLAGNPRFDFAGLTGLPERPEAMPFRDLSRESFAIPAPEETGPDAAQDTHPVSESLASLADRASLPKPSGQASAAQSSVSTASDPIVIAFWPQDGASRFTEISSDDAREWDLFFQTAAQPETRLAAPAAEASAQEDTQGTAAGQPAAFSPAHAAGRPVHREDGTGGGFPETAYMPAKQGMLMEQLAGRRSETVSDAASPASVYGPPARQSDVLNAEHPAAETPADPANIDAAALLEFGQRLDAVEARLRAMREPQDYPKLTFALKLPQAAPRQWPSLHRQSAPANGSAHSSLAFPAAEAGGAPAFALVAGALSGESAALRDAGIGDRVPKFGTVTDIVNYAEGGRILVMENGSVFLN